MNLDPGHALAKRRGLVIDQAKPGDADQHELALELSGVCLVAEHIRRRDEATCIVWGVVDPQASVGLSGDDQVADSHGFNPGHAALHEEERFATDRKSTRLNSSHGYISYAVFCLKKK